MSEWSKMDAMMSIGIKAFVDSQTLKPTVPPSSTSEGSIQALACVLSVPMASRVTFGNDKSIFSGMSSLALESLLNDLVLGMHSKTFEVAASALQVFGHWTTSKQGKILYIDIKSASDVSKLSLRKNCPCRGGTNHRDRGKKVIHYVERVDRQVKCSPY